MSTARLGTCPALLDLCVRPGRVLDIGIELRERVTGALIDWPPGTLARLGFSWGTGAELRVDGLIDGPHLLFHLGGDVTELIPRNAAVALELNYMDGDEAYWLVWCEGRTGSCT
jgi:hypothetical protein